MTMTAALSFAQLSVRAETGRLLIDELTLTLPGPGLYGIVGPNGAGKSSLLRAAIGLLPACAGEITLAGRALDRWSPAELARHLGYIPQKLRSHWDLSVSEMLRLQGAWPAPELLARCQLEPLLARRFATLSGGEQARVALARALAHQPALVLADEPAAHLDLPHQHHLLRLLGEEARTRTVVVVLHDLHLASRYCSQVILLANARLLACGAPERVLTRPHLAQAYGEAVFDASSAGQRFFFLP